MKTAKPGRGGHGMNKTRECPYSDSELRREYLKKKREIIKMHSLQIQECKELFFNHGLTEVEEGHRDEFGNFIPKEIWVYNPDLPIQLSNNQHIVESSQSVHYQDL